MSKKNQGLNSTTIAGSGTTYSRTKILLDGADNTHLAEHIVLRRRILGASVVLPARYVTPVVAAVVLPAHAQGSPIDPPRTFSPQFALSRLLTALRIPSGEPTPVDALDRVQLSACDFPPGESVTVDCVATLSPSGTIDVFSQSASINDDGRLDLDVAVDETILIPIAALATLEFQITWSGGSEVYIADSATVTDAVNGRLPPAVCVDAV